MLDISVAYNRYKFLGHEFLTWLWFMIETDPESLKNNAGELVFLEIGDRIVLENSRREAMETITIKGSESEMEEGRMAVKRGAVVTELNLRMHYNKLLWLFDIKGKSLDLSGLKLPEIDKTDRPSQPDGDSREALVLEKIDLCETVLGFVRHLYTHFITLRISKTWQDKTVPQIKKWVTAS